jgi:hypothetical protein
MTGIAPQTRQGMVWMLWTRHLLIAAMTTCLVWACGCDKSARQGSRGGSAAGSRATNQQRGEILVGTIDTLFRLEAYEFGQAEDLVMSRLNQWLRGQELNIPWEKERRLQDLTAKWRQIRGVAALENDNFLYEHDFAFLREAAWMHRIAAHVRAQMQTDEAEKDSKKSTSSDRPALSFVSRDDPEELRLAMRLFDWTVKNVQLEEDTWPESTSYKLPRNWHTPYETVLLGRGTAGDRAWVFILLARQQGLDVVMLGLGADDGEIKPWIPALILADPEKNARAANLFLFDPALGLPIPDSQTNKIATLAQVAADDALLRQLDLDAKRPYPIKAEQIQVVTALVEASPGYLSRRMTFLESRLAGQQRMVLSVLPSAIEEKLAGSMHVRKGTKLWTRPFETFDLRERDDPALAAAAATELYPLQGLQRRIDETASERKALARREESQEWGESLGKPGPRSRVRVPLGVGRMMLLAGNFDREIGAVRYLQQAMASEPEQDEVMQAFLEMEPGANPARRQQIAERAKDVVRELRRSDQAAKLWFGQLKAETGEYKTAIDYFTEWEIPLWRGAIDYSLARVYEAQGDLAKAIQTYREDESPQRTGNLLRARRLEKMVARDDK